MQPNCQFPILLLVFFYPSLPGHATECGNQLDDLQCPTWFPSANCTQDKKRPLCPRLCGSCDQIELNSVMRVAGKGRKKARSGFSSRKRTREPGTHSSSHDGSSSSSSAGGSLKGSDESYNPHADSDQHSSDSAHSSPRDTGPKSNKRPGPELSKPGPSRRPRPHPAAGSSGSPTSPRHRSPSRGRSRSPLHVPSRSPSRSRSRTPPHSPNEVPYEFFAQRVDREIDPCTDFYEFACGKYIAQHRTQLPLRNFDTKTDQEERAKQQQKRLVMDRLLSPQPGAETLMKLYRDKCRRPNSENQQQIPELWAKIAQMEDQGFPTFSDSTFIERFFDFDQMVVKMGEATGTQFVYQFEIEETITGHPRPTIRAPGLIAPSAGVYFGARKVEKIRSLQHYVTRVLRMIEEDLGIQNDRNLTADIERVLIFDYDLAYALVQHRDEEEKEKTMAEVKRELTAVDWSHYLGQNSLIPNDVKTYLTDERTVLVHTESALKAMDTLYKEADKRVLANYFFIRFILLHVPYLGGRYFDEYNQLKYRVYETPIPVDRTNFCFDHIDQYFKLVVDYLYITRHVPAYAFTSLNPILNNLRVAMQRILWAQDWMTDETKNHAIRKLQRTRVVLGVEQHLHYGEHVNREFAGLQLTPAESFFEMTVKLRKYDLHKLLMQMVSPNHALIFRYPITEVNVKHWIIRNEIFISTAAINPPFLEFGQPAAVSYGLIGFLAGRELTHGFDEIGSQFDENNIQQTWWTGQTRANFVERGVSLTRFYAEVIEPISGKPVDGAQTFIENVADDGGVRVAFDGYTFHLGGGVERHVPGFGDFNNNQTFFISYASGFCSHYTPGRAGYLVKTDIHAPDRMRVNTVLSNYPEFANAFECAKGTPMNPHEQAVVWVSPTH